MKKTEKERKNDSHSMKDKGRDYSHIPDRMFQDVKIPESLAPTPINPGIDEANQINIPRNPGPATHALDWDVLTEPLVNNPSVPPTPNPHTNEYKSRDKKQK